MKCYVCGEGMKSKGPNRKKMDGKWMHKLCPAEKARRIERAKEKKIREKKV